MELIKVNNVIPTAFEDGTHWSKYKYNNFVSYELIEVYQDAADLEEKYNSNIELYNKLTNKININSINEPLRGLIYDTLYSGNDMLYIDDIEEAEAYNINAADLEQIKKEIEKYNLYDYIEINTQYLIIIYGGIITKFLF